MITHTYHIHGDSVLMRLFILRARQELTGHSIEEHEGMVVISTTSDCEKLTHFLHRDWGNWLSFARQPALIEHTKEQRGL